MRCGPGRTAREHRRGARLDRDHAQLAVGVLAQVFAHAGDRAARADARHEHVDAVLERARDLGTGRAPVRLRVRGIGELVGQVDVGLAREHLRRLDGLVHAAERLGDVDAGAVQAQQALALFAHPLRKREHEVVALGRADERERDPGVAARRLDDRGAARLDPAFGLGGLDHRYADAVLHAPARVEGLELGEQLHPALGRGRALEHAGYPDERRVSDELRNVDRDCTHLGADNSGARAALPAACRRRSRGRRPRRPRDPAAGVGCARRLPPSGRMPMIVHVRYTPRGGVRSASARRVLRRTGWLVWAAPPRRAHLHQVRHRGSGSASAGRHPLRPGKGEPDHQPAPPMIGPPDCPPRRRAG